MSSLAETVKYETKILEVGSEARGFKDINMAILFDDQSYKITAVGNEVNTNLGNLGHTAIVFDGSTTPELAGSLYLEEKTYPELDVGTTIKIIRA